MVAGGGAHVARVARARLRHAARRPPAPPLPRRPTSQLAAAGDRFTTAPDDANEQAWTEPWFFAQLADTQFGMFTRDETWEEEKALAARAVERINKIKPKFVVVCGDLVNALPNGPQPKPEAQEAQVQDFKKVMGRIDEDIRLVCVCGNHDVGDRPNAATVRRYTGRFGAGPAPTPTYPSLWILTH